MNGDTWRSLINWIAIGAIGEVVGAIAAVVSIIYLSRQVKSPTRMVRARVRFDATHSRATVNEGIAAADGDTGAHSATIPNQPPAR